MAENCEFKMILHSSDFKEIQYIKLFDQKKKIEGNELNFELSKDKFNSFDISLPSKLNMLNLNGEKVVNFCLNLLKEKNTYHLFAGGHMELYELLFYREDKIELIVDNEEIKEFDSFSQFKRFSLINIGNYEIKINGITINLEEFLNNNGNSFQLSFYDINQKYIVSKGIVTKQNMNFSLFYGKYINDLNKYCLDLDKLLKKSNNFEVDLSDFNKKCLKINIKITRDLNLNIPKKELEIQLNDEKYLIFIFLYIKIYISYIFEKNNLKVFDDFKQLINYFEAFFKILKNDNDYKIFEKISILFHLSGLFKILKSCKLFFQANFHYIKVEKIEKYSVINLAIEYLYNYINNLNTESAEYFKLIEINSGYGFYKSDKVFTYDMIDLCDLKNHLRESIPSVFCFYSLDDIKNTAFTNPLIIGICLNESKLFKDNERFSLDKNYFETRKYEVKNVTMKLVFKIKHECFGHIKFQMYSDISDKKISDTPKKCFDNKRLKQLVRINDIIENNTINVLVNNNRSDSGNYLESSFGQLPGAKYYTSVYLKMIKNIGNLFDHPELFYQNENLERLQKFAYYKYLYEKEKDKIIDDKYKSFNFEQEMDFLVNYFKSSNINLEENNLFPLNIKTRKMKKCLGRKIKRIEIKKSDEINETEQKEVEQHKSKKKKIIPTKIYDREKIAEILEKKNLNDSQLKFYFNLLLESTPKD